MGKFKGVLFDFDGTIMDTNEIILGSWRHVYQTLFKRDPDYKEITWTFGEPLFDTMAHMFPDRDTNEMVELYREYQRHIYNKPIHMFPGIKEMVYGLKERGVKVAIVTSRLWSTTNQGLYHFDISDDFDVVISAEDTKAHKPDPEPCYMAMERLGMSADEVLMLGDSRFDLVCAHNAGIRFALVGWTICLPPERRTGINIPDYIIEKPEDIYKLVL